MTLAFPTALAPRFLATNLAPATTLAQETALWDRFTQNSLPEQFQTLTELRYHYFKNRALGGLDGLRWVDDVRTGLLEEIECEERHREFVVFREDGTAYAEFPSDVAPPFVLNFSEEWGRPPVIPLSASPRLKSMGLAYFSIGALHYLETKVDWNEIDAATADIKNRKKRAPIDVAVSPDRSRFFGEGLNLSLAVYLSGRPYVLGRVNEGYPGKRGLSLAQVLTAPKAKPAEDVPLAPIVTRLAFTPRFDLEFPPLRTTLRRHGQPCPAVIERFFPEDVDQLPEDLRRETVGTLAAEKDDPGTPFLRALRTLDGEIQAVALAFLVPENGKIRMKCTRTSKRDLETVNRLEGVGLAFLLSSLQYMKRNGYWHDSGPLLYYLIPRVANGYRRRAGLPLSNLSVVSVVLDGISACEGDEFLRKSPLKFEPALPTSAPAATAEAVFVDGRPAG